MSLRPRFDHIRQRSGDMQCGPACVAIVSGNSLEKVREHTKYYKDDPDLGTWYANLRGALASLGMTYDDVHRRVSQWDKVKGVAIVACRTDESPRSDHWVVFDSYDGLIYDPERNAPSFHQERRDLRPTSYMQVWTWNTLGNSGE